jgi:hypothetical protein
MSEENVEIVRSIHDAFNRGDWDATSPPSAASFATVIAASGRQAV